VSEVLTVSPADYEPNPSILDERRRNLLAGAYKLKDGLLVMLKPERVDPLRQGSLGQNAVNPSPTQSPVQAA
jgi:purine-binding chemotaxis protein CheW